jgi:hypothetical protein
MLAEMMASVFTFKKATAEKMAFISLNVIDLVLTLFAVSIGAIEINPIMRDLLSSPFALYSTKLIIPFLFAWLLPGRLLIPAIAILVFVVGWDVRELICLFL